MNPIDWLRSKSQKRNDTPSQRRRRRRRTLKVESLERREVMTGVIMTPHEQLLLELVNRARNEPAAEAARYGIALNKDLAAGTISTDAKQPLAPNQFLVDAAGDHSQDMIDRDFFAHTNPDGQNPSARAQEAGYGGGVAENISYGGSTGSIDQVANTYERHRRLFLSSGHRRNLMSPGHQEVGMGVRFGKYTSGNYTYNVGMVTEKFANPPGNSFLTGVAFTDASDGSDSDNDFYNIGEQITSGTITATNTSSNESFTTQIGPSGGYALQIPNGTYNVTATGGALPGDYIVGNVTIASRNVKVDFETTTAASAPEDPDALNLLAPIRFDFGTASSPVTPGYTRVTAGTTYTEARGYGWSGGRVVELDRGTGTYLHRDLHYRDVATFVVDVPNGTFEVDLNLGDAGPYAHDQQVFLEDSLAGTVATAASEIVTRSYEVEVTDGQLTIRLDGRGGVDPNMVITGLQITEIAPTPALSLSIATDSVSEGGQTANATVTRNGSTSGALVVNLASGDSGELWVPSSVTIPDGEASVSFNVRGVDDADVDGTQNVSVVASANGFESDSDSIDVLDDERAPLTYKFDFGTGSSPLQSGHTRVTAGSTYNASRGHGWTGAKVKELDRKTGSNLNRDLHYRDVGTFVVDVPNGSYEVALHLGDSGPYRHDQQVFLEDQSYGTVSTGASEVVTRTYNIAVNDGQLTVRLDGRGGVDPNMVISGLSVTEVAATPTLSIAYVATSVSENGETTTGTVSRSGDTSGSLRVNLSTDDPGELWVPSSVTIPDGESSADFTIRGVDDHQVDGSQRVRIHATASGLEDGWGVVDVLDDERAPLSHRFDFGTGNSPVQSGYTRVTAGSTYTESRGHGWTGAKVRELDRQSGSNLNRDLHYRDVGTFVVDVPNGSYEVALTVGDAGPYRHDQQVFLEGDSVDNIATAGNQLVTRTYEVAVNDGQLTLRLDGRGGVDPNMVISGLTITEVAATPALSISLADSSISENGATTTGTVTRRGGTSGALVVSLSRDDSGELWLPNTVTIPDGAASANFTARGVDDAVIDGTQRVTMTARASGLENGTATINILDDERAPISHNFDFGTATSPVESGHTRVTAGTTYNASRGHGWIGGKVRELDRKSGSNLHRDLHYRDVGTFVVDVPNGTYEVALTVGDTGPYRHDQQVFFEETSVDNIATAGGQVVTRTYNVVVTDGQMTLRLDGRGGVDPNMVIMGMRVTETAN